MEKIAQRWADQCNFEHDAVRTKLDRTRVGQNLAVKIGSGPTQQSLIMRGMATHVQDWYDEVTTPGFDSKDINPFK